MSQDNERNEGKQICIIVENILKEQICLIFDSIDDLICWENEYNKRYTVVASYEIITTKLMGVSQ